MKTAKMFLALAVVIGAAAYACAESASTAAAPDTNDAAVSNMPLDMLISKAKTEGDETTKRKYIKAIARYEPSDDKTLAKLADLVSEGDVKSPTSEAAYRSLLNVAHSEKSFSSSIVKLMDHKNARVRFAAIVVAGRKKDKAAISGLVKRLDDKDSYVASRACQALSEIGDESALPELGARIGKPGGYGIAIANFGLPGLQQILKEMGKPNRSKEEKIRIAQALGFFHDPKTTGMLKDLLKSNDRYVRLNAIQSLGNMKDASVAEAVKDSDSLVRLYVVEAMRKGDSPSVTSKLIDVFIGDKSPEVRIVAAAALGDKKAKDAIPHLKEALQDPNPDIRVSAERALTAIMGEASK